MADSLIPVAPTLDEPLEILAACHGRVLAQLDTLRRLLQHLPTKGADAQAQQAAAAVLRYFDTAARHHHEDEEIDLLPALEAHASADIQQRVTAVRERILAEHARMFALWAALRPQLSEVRLGLGSALDEELAFELDQLYRQHIDYEESSLLPLAREVLSDVALRPLSLAMTARRSPPAADG